MSKRRSSAAPVKAGWQDWHCHLDRANTARDENFQHTGGGFRTYSEAPLVIKQNATGDLHLGPAYATEEILFARMEQVVQAKIAGGETMVNAIVDCSPDIDGRAFRAALKLREKYRSKITINVGAYPIFGFKTHGSERQRHLEELAVKAQFLVGLPERDGRGDADNNVGFDGHLAILLELSLKHQIPVQVHVDQTNLPTESGTERLVAAVNWLYTCRVAPEKRPRVYAVHVISPSSYDEERFWSLVRGLRSNRIGVIVCPRAALSMRQIRSSLGPMRNSIARVKELLVSGIEVRFGTDNINDIFMPHPASPLLARETGPDGVIHDALRLYEQSVYDKLMRGEKLNEIDLMRIEESLKGDYAAAGWRGERPWRNR